MLATEKKVRQAAKVLAVYQIYLESGDLRNVGPADEKTYQDYLALVHNELDDATFNTAWAEGQKMTLEQAIEYALENVK